MEAFPRAAKHIGHRRVRVQSYLLYERIKNLWQELVAKQTECETLQDENSNLKAELNEVKKLREYFEHESSGGITSVSGSSKTRGKPPCSTPLPQWHSCSTQVCDNGSFSFVCIVFIVSTAEDLISVFHFTLSGQRNSSHLTDFWLGLLQSTAGVCQLFVSKLDSLFRIFKIWFQFHVLKLQRCCFSGQLVNQFTRSRQLCSVQLRDSFHFPQWWWLPFLRLLGD